MARISQNEDLAETPAAPASVRTKLDTTRVHLGQSIRLTLLISPGRLATLWRDGRFIESHAQAHDSIAFTSQQLHSGRNTFALWSLDSDGRSGLIDSFTIDFRSLRLDLLRQSITEIPTAGNSVALTFDGGSLDRGAQEILDVLKRENIRCTIFLTGDFIRRYSELTRRISADGHEAANHSFHHPHLTSLEKDGGSTTLPHINRNVLQRELLRTDSLFHACAARNMSLLWRAPYGEINNEILTWAAEIGYRHIGWSQHGDTRDWVADPESKLYRNGKQILEAVMNLEKKSGLNGKIILMHLGSERNGDEAYRILGEMIGKIRQKGYHFATISEMLEANHHFAENKR
jgi:peptidoglycan/xylan/chitin deacetylase (PgdA/CDA1 family)